MEAPSPSLTGVELATEGRALTWASLLDILWLPPKLVCSSPCGTLGVGLEHATLPTSNAYNPSTEDFFVLFFLALARSGREEMLGVWVAQSMAVPLGSSPRASAAKKKRCCALLLNGMTNPGKSIRRGLRGL